MKKHNIIIIALFCVLGSTAQTNEGFVFKEYGSDSWDTIAQTGIERRIDINDDGDWDIRYYADINWEEMLYPKLFAHQGACFHRLAGSWEQYQNTFIDFNTPFNDSSLTWKVSIFPEMAWAHYHRYDTITFKSGIREGVEGEYYYGWVEVYAVNTYDTIFFHVARTCYCTIPNYPLRWGQTSMAFVEENGEKPFPFVYPNPTLGLVSVMGSNLRQIEVYNALGQRVITQLADGDRTTINLNKQPAGIYFVNITDKEGKRCVKKVVKQ